MANALVDAHREAQPGKQTLSHFIETLGAIAGHSKAGDLTAVLDGLLEKLSANRFNLAVLGQMKRGKSSFVNALLGTEILPTGILPLTSVITRVKYGPSPTALIRFKSGNVEPIELTALREYITEAGNPGNRKQVAAAEVTYPSQFLGMGIDLIDTPGIGSTHLQNTSTTEDYLSKVDAGIVVLSVDPPITEVESDFLRKIRRDVPRLLFVINKIDVVSPREADSVVRFLEGELKNRIGVDNPELFPLSARLALEERTHQHNGSAVKSGMERLAERLRHFASEEKEQVLLQSVAVDVLRIAGTLQFAASVGERARALNGEELESKKCALETTLASSDREMKDLRHLLRQDVATIVARIESDLKHHVESADPALCQHLLEFEKAHPNETRDQLGTLLDKFVFGEVECVFADWRVQEDRRIHTEVAELSERFVERTNRVLEHLQDTAGSLFDVPISHVDFRSSLTVESRLYYYTDHVFQYQLDKLIFILPKFLLRQIVFTRMRSYIRMELDRNAGRLRYDYLERLEKSVAAFEKGLESAVAIVVDNLRFVLEPKEGNASSPTSAIAQLEPVVAGCRSIIEAPGRTLQRTAVEAQPGAGPETWN
jgi:GTP-binding protein EngB required for normal cell division